MESLLNRIKNQRWWDFPGGVHPPSRKDISNQGSIDNIALPELLHVSVKQHIGSEGKIKVEVGQRVLKGEALTHSANPFSVPVHAPTSGTIEAIDVHPSAHPSALPEMAVHIKPDGLGQWIDLKPMQDYQQQNKSKVVEAICKAGISGMGGAGFPTHIKVSPKKDVQFLIINGIECEPYITSDDRLMREYAWQIRQGIDVLQYLLNPKQVLIGIEDNKPEAAEAMRVACRDNEQYQICVVPTKYPAGGEKQLIQTLTGQEVPQNGLPVDIGVIMQNVGTCYAIADAIFSGKPLIQRVVTLTGEQFDAPQNVWAPIGTPISHLLAHAGYQPASTERLIMGGPMMGFALANDHIPVVKTTNCILAPSLSEMPLPPQKQACIRCSACADACPASLLPQQLLWYAKADDHEKAQEYNLFDCIECGACAYVCPSDIPLVHYYRTAKADIRSAQQEKIQADKARERFEARKARLERDQIEREEKHRQAAEARKQAMQADGSDAKAKIAAALARAKAKKAPSEDTSQTADEADNKKQQVADAIARAKAKRAAKQSDATIDKAQDGVSGDELSNADNATKPADAAPADVKKQQVAEAIARAKAKRTAKLAEESASESSEEESTPIAADSAQDDKKQQVAAAIARAKAKREAKLAEQQSAANDKAADNQQTDAEPAGASSADNSEPEYQQKKQRVAAAIAKAKAKKAAQQRAEKPQDGSESEAISEPEATSESLSSETDTPENEQQTAQDKKQRIAAAVAKAKARQQAKKDAQEDNS
ncbi:electron transport complex subunit RsxC [Neptunicella marina]|uniref:Ion-translocating oxidoreductase complex subunit C n=1 Tax=Neptunicella marina TaxID=2125989 RepID=A0A8J6IW59_9ALTE|nr:electron transport complex subunit RsxC [Neptunicella marina]